MNHSPTTRENAKNNDIPAHARFYLRWGRG